MPVPKRKQSRSRRDSREANKHIIPQVAAICKEENCKSPMMPHTICGACGYHKGIKILTIKVKKDKIEQSVSVN